MPVTVTVPAVVVFKVRLSPLPPAWMVRPAAPICVRSIAPKMSRPVPALTVVAVPAAVLVTLMVSPLFVPLTIKDSRPE